MSQLNSPSARLINGVIPAWSLVVIAIVSIQIGAAVAKQLFDTTGPAGVVFLRTLLGGLMFCALWRPKLHAYNREAYLYLIVYGFVIAMMMMTFYAAIDRIPLGITVAIAFAGPLGVAIVNSRRLADIGWVILAALGVLLLSPLANVSLDPFGIILALLSALTWAMYILLTKQVIRRVDGNAALALSMIIAALFALPLGFSGALKVLADPTLLLLSGVVALLSSAIPFGLEFMAMKELTPRAFGLLVSLEPVVAALIGLVALGEGLELHEIVGISLVTLAAVATTKSASH